MCQQLGSEVERQGKANKFTTPVDTTPHTRDIFTLKRADTTVNNNYLPPHRTLHSSILGKIGQRIVVVM